MATTEVMTEPHDRQVHRRRPFSTWVRKLANFKSSDSERAKRQMKKKRGHKVNNPYPQSGHVSENHGMDQSIGSFGSGAQTGSNRSLGRSLGSSVAHEAPRTAGEHSLARAVSLGPPSIIAPSHGAGSLTGTTRTGGEGMESGRGDSTFSSPAPSVRSLATTLTTIQSFAPNGQTGGALANQPGNSQSIQFSQPFPNNQPVSAIPAHLAPSGGPTTYTSATANGVLTDNASILTLASSSKRRRRRSMDTDASVRALAPSSLWGGSRESLPLSVLSSNIEGAGVPATPGLHGSSSRIGAERNSLYSATGVAPAITSERNSIYQKTADGASIRSGLLGHSRNDSIGGSNSVIGGNSLAIPKEEDGEKPAMKENLEEEQVPDIRTE